MHPLAQHLPIGIRARLPPRAMDDAHEVRFRVGAPIELRTGARSEFAGDELSEAELREVVSMLANHSLYALESQFRQGYFTLPGGCRVGITGAYADGMLAHPAFVSVRVAREVRGAADALMPHILRGGAPRNALVLSAPMMGKTTLLRDAARQLSESGLRVAIADERGELAGCLNGRPQLDVGPRTDVCDGVPKRDALPMLIRAMAPDVLVTDELGHAGDAEAVMEAARCGVRVLASAHADSLDGARGRAALAPLFRDGLFDVIALLGSEPGRIVQICTGGEVRRA